MFCGQAVNRRHCPKNVLAPPAPSTRILCAGCGQGSLWRSGVPDLPSTTRWRALPGTGSPSMGHWSKPRLLARRSVATRPIGEKNGSKRHLLVDGRGVPLSIVVTGANRHDASQLELVLDEIVIERPEDVEQRLCGDKGFSGEPARQAIEARNYIAHIKQRGEEIKEKKTNPGCKARRWVLEVSHSWFNRFRKLLVRYEKLTATYMALLHMAAAIIAFRKIGVIYG